MRKAPSVCALLAACLLAAAPAGSQTPVHELLTAKADVRRVTAAVPADPVKKLNYEKWDPVHTKMSRHLVQAFDVVEDIDWSETADGFTAFFQDQGIQCRVQYNAKGNWLKTVRTYGKAYLPLDVRCQVKTSFPKYDIYLVSEIRYSQETIFVLSLANETSWKIVRVGDDGMRIYKEFKKG